MLKHYPWLMSRPAANADVFAAIADPTRRSLLDQLRQGEQPVKQLAAPFDMSLPAISQHLILKFTFSVAISLARQLTELLHGVRNGLDICFETTIRW